LSTQVSTHTIPTKVLKIFLKFCFEKELRLIVGLDKTFSLLRSLPQKTIKIQKHQRGGAITNETMTNTTIITTSSSLSFVLSSSRLSSFGLVVVVFWTLGGLWTKSRA
jgi:hypothetical protein